MIPPDPQLTLPVPPWHRELDLAYAAGLIDGEGTITIARRHLTNKTGRYTTYKSLVAVSNTDANMVLWLREMFGGYLLARRYSQPRGHLYRWTVDGRPAEACLRELLPYLRTKAEQAQLALALRDDMAETHRWPNHRLTAEDRDRREALKQRMLVLNGRARRPFVALSASTGTGV